MYHDALNELFKFSQDLKMQGKQHDDFADSLASLFQNVLNCKPNNGLARSRFSRKQLGI